MLNGRHPNSVLVFFECIFTYGRVDSCPGSMIVSTVTKKDKSGRDPMEQVEKASYTIRNMPGTMRLYPPGQGGGSGSMSSRSNFDAVLKTVVAVSLVVAVLGFPGAWVQTGTAFSAQRQVLRYVEGTDVTPIDPAYCVDTPTSSIIHLVYDNLVMFRAPDMQVVPDLATSWKIGADRKTWTFTLRSGVRFTDGTPANADAVVYSIERVANPKNASPYRTLFDEVASVKSLNDTTVQIITKDPYPSLLDALGQVGGGIVSPTAAKPYEADPRRFGEHPVGSGPFEVRSWVPGQQTVLVRNPDYWGKPPALDEIDWRGVPDASVREAMVKSGEADIIAKAPIQDLNALRKVPGIKVLAESSMYMVNIELNNQAKPLDDVRVRRALNYAINKEAIVKDLLFGYGRVNDSPLPFGVQFRVALTPYPYDPAKAKALLAEAGASKFTLNLWAPHGRYMQDSQIGEAVANYLQAVGITVKYRVWEWAPYMQALNAPDRMALLLGRATPGTDFTMTRQYSKTAWNLYNIGLFYDPQVEKLIAEARIEFDEGTRAKLYAEAQRRVWEDAPYIFLDNQDQLYALRDTVHGFQTLPDEFVYLEGVHIGQ